MPDRIEHDSLGDWAVPADSDYGVHTARAAANFPITGTLLCHYPELIIALAMTKKAAAEANAELGALDPKIARAIAKACDRLIAGENKVKVWRSHRGLSGRDLAAAAGVSAPFISEIESGKKDASLAVMKKIADALKVDLDDLV